MAHGLHSVGSSPQIQHHMSFDFASSSTMPSAFQRPALKESHSGPHGRAGKQAKGGFPGCDTRRLSLPEGFSMELLGLRSYPDELQNICNPACVPAHEASQSRCLGPAISNELTFSRLPSKHRQAPGFSDLKTPSVQSAWRSLLPKVDPMAFPVVCRCLQQCLFCIWMPWPRMLLK